MFYARFPWTGISALAVSELVFYIENVDFFNGCLEESPRELSSVMKGRMGGNKPSGRSAALSGWPKWLQTVVK